MLGSSLITLTYTISDHITFSLLFDCPKTSGKHLSANNIEEWEKYREHLISIVPSKFRSIIWQKFVLNACCIDDPH